MTRYTHSAIGVEIQTSLKDVITSLSPVDTPLVSMLPTSKATTTVHEFVRQTISRPTDNGATVEGAAVTFPTAVAPVRETNWVQTITQAWKVTLEQEASSRVGGEKEYAYRKLEAMKIWKMKLERSILLNTGAAGSQTVAREMKGLINGAGVVGNTATLNNTLTENGLMSYLQTIWNQAESTNDLIGVCSANVKRGISTAFFGAITRNLAETDRSKIQNYIEYYQTDFGLVEFVASKDLTGSNDSRMVILSKKAYSIAYLLEPKAEDITTGTSNSKEGKIVGMATLEFLFPQAAIKVFNISY